MILGLQMLYIAHRILHLSLFLVACFFAYSCLAIVVRSPACALLLTFVLFFRTLLSCLLSCLPIDPCSLLLSYSFWCFYSLTVTYSLLLLTILLGLQLALSNLLALSHLLALTVSCSSACCFANQLAFFHLFPLACSPIPAIPHRDVT